MTNLNHENVAIDVTRIELCDLLLACLAARDATTDGGKKWVRLHDKLRAQLDKFDEQYSA